MDAHDLFKKLSAGTKFDTKRFRHDAEKFRVIDYLFLFFFTKFFQFCGII